MNKYSLMVLCACLVAASSAPFDSVVDVTEDTLGNYRFAFDSGDYSKIEERSEDGSINGKFTFVDPHGVHHTVTYHAAAEHGVFAEGADIPVAVSDTLENQHARVSHLEIIEAVQNDPRFAETPEDNNEDPISPEEYLVALKEQLNPSVPFVFQEDTPEIAAAKIDHASAHVTAVGH